MRNMKKHQLTSLGHVDVGNKHRVSFMDQCSNTENQTAKEQTTIANVNQPINVPQPTSLEQQSIVDVESLEEQTTSTTQSFDLMKVLNTEQGPETCTTAEQTDLCVRDKLATEAMSECVQKNWSYIQNKLRELPKPPNRNQKNINVQYIPIVQASVTKQTPGSYPNRNPSQPQLTPLPSKLQGKDALVAVPPRAMQEETVDNCIQTETAGSESSNFTQLLEREPFLVHGCLGEPYVSIYSLQNEEIVSRSIQEMDREFNFGKFKAHNSIDNDPQPSTSTRTAEKRKNDNDFSDYFECFHLDKDQCLNNFNDTATQIPENPDFGLFVRTQQSPGEAITTRKPKREPSSLRKPKRRTAKKKPRALMCPLIFQTFYNVKVRDIDVGDIPFTDMLQGLQPVLSVNFPPAIAVTNKLMIIGRGPRNHLDLDFFGQCNFVSVFHAMMFYDEFTDKFKLFNRSPYGTQIDEVIYGINQETGESSGKRAPKSNLVRKNAPGKTGGCICVHKAIVSSLEQTIALKHGSTISFGCISFVFSALSNRN